MGKKKSDAPLPPVVRVAPLGDLKAYIVSEHELEALARGSSGSLYLNFALALLPVSLTLFVTLLTTIISSDRLFVTFVCVAVIAAIIGTLLLLMWYREHRSWRTLMADIKSRMPPRPGDVEQITVFERLLPDKSSETGIPKSPE